MEPAQFRTNLEQIYKLKTESDKEINKFYTATITQGKEREILDIFLGKNNLPKTKESRFAVAKRIISLKDDSLTQFLKKEKIPTNQIEIIKEDSYKLTRKIHMVSHRKLIEKIENRQLLPPFYIEILKGTHSVGSKMNDFHVKWNKYIINTINKNLEDEFASQEKIMDFLEKNNLLDRGHGGKIADRSYSALKKTFFGYKSKSYKTIFPREVSKIIRTLKIFRANLSKLEDKTYNQKKEYINYLTSLISAFGETSTNSLVEKWAKVDSNWMEITTPLQIGHPLEYYEDHYRKAVAAGWDMRIQNPDSLKNTTGNKVAKTYDKLFKQFEKESYKKVYQESTANLKKVQLYLGKPLLYYGAQFNGLFSAQVVPNDQIISKQKGKKIFAFADMILENLRNRPFTKLSREVYEQEYIDESRKFLFNETEKWHKIYDAATIGHEFGHILWLEENTETEMNKTGNFKNIEEFKATVGGIITFFENEEDSIKKYFIKDVIDRAVGLIGWMEVGETRPYYIEGLIHLKILFDSKIISWNGKKIHVNITKKSYDITKKSYRNIYNKLAKYYLEKKDAILFMQDYTMEEDKKILPKDKKIKEFALWFYEKYKEYGNQVDETVSKEDYIN